MLIYRDSQKSMLGNQKLWPWKPLSAQSISCSIRPSLPGIIDLCFLCFVLRQQRFKVRSLIKILVYVSITHHRITLSHTHTPLATKHCLKWCVDPRFVGRCPIRPLPSIYLWPAVRRGEGPWSYISKQQQLAWFNQCNSHRLYRGHCPTHTHTQEICPMQGHWLKGDWFLHNPHKIFSNCH